MWVLWVLLAPVGAVSAGGSCGGLAAAAGGRGRKKIVFQRVKSKKLQAIAASVQRRQFPVQCSSRKVLAVKDGVRFWGPKSICRSSHPIS
jgi:hypothetical protein